MQRIFAHCTAFGFYIVYIMTFV